MSAAEKGQGEMLRGLPPTVSVDLTRDGLREYWLARAAQHTQDSYAGVPLSKFPEDLRAYEHLLWQSRPDVVIELGVQYGGSALWFRDRLLSLARYGGSSRPRVIGVERAVRGSEHWLAKADPAWSEHIVLIEGDVRDPELPERVAAELEPGASYLVVEDTAHEFETTYAALAGFARFVAPEGYFVVEDGCVDDDLLRLPEWPRGVRPAIDAWLATPAGADFRVRRDLELYGVSRHPSGFLQRRFVAEAP